MDPKERLAQVLKEANELDAKGTLDGADATRMEALIVEGRALRAQVTQKAGLGEMNDWASRSAGMLAMASPGGAAVETITPSGSTTIMGTEDRKTGRGALRIAEEYGEGLFDPHISAQIRNPDYKKAFRSYLRTPIGMPYDGAAMRTLQEGADTGGGLA